MGMLKSLALGALALAAGGAAASSPAQALTVSIDWYSVANTVPDFNLLPCGGGQDCGQDFSNEVNTTLTGGLPTDSSPNPAALAEGGGNPLNWWNSSISGITFEGTTQQTMPVIQSMFPPEGKGSGDGSSFQTAILRTTVDIGPGGGTVSINGDDDVFLADGTAIIGQVGGIYPFTSGDEVTVNLDPGVHNLTLFYADRHVTDAQLLFQVTGTVPEPSTWAMMFVGFGLLGFAAVRQRRRTATAIA